MAMAMGTISGFKKGREGAKTGEAGLSTDILRSVKDVVMVTETAAAPAAPEAPQKPEASAQDCRLCRILRLFCRVLACAQNRTLRSQIIPCLHCQLG